MPQDWMNLANPAVNTGNRVHLLPSPPSHQGNSNHSLDISLDGDIYGFGRNRDGSYVR